MPDVSVSLVGVLAIGSVGNTSVWGMIIDSQTPTWQAVNDSQTINWTAIDDTQTPGWTQTPT